MQSDMQRNEAARLEALHRYQILDTPPEEAYDDLLSLAARVCAVPIAVINFVDADRQWFKSKLGLEFKAVPRSVGFGAQCMLLGDLLVIPDALADPRHACNPVVTGYPFARFYAGVPLFTPDGQAVGTLCVLDREPRQLDEGQIASLWAIARQIVGQLELRRHVEELRQTALQNKQMARALAAVTDGVVITDPLQPNNPIVYANSAFSRITGYAPTELVGRNCRILSGPETDRQTRRRVREAVAAGREVQATLLNYRKDGRPFWNELKISPVHDESGALVNFVGIQTDVTEKKQLELQSLRAQRLESLGTLASGIAHDLNNILAPILMSVQLLQRLPLEQQAKRLLDSLELNVRRGASLIKQVLSFARGVDGERTVLQVRHIVGEIQQIMRETFPKSIDVRVDLAPNLWPLLADATQMHQVLMNLCVNARDAMPWGGVLRIAATNMQLDAATCRQYLEAREGPYVVFTVSDTGTGIPPEVLDRIFEPFFTTKKPGEGTGLGLSTLLGIVKSHGGFVAVESRPSQGTEFRIYLPAVECDEIAPPPLPEPVQGDGELILVVDDELPLRQVIETCLQTHNYRVLTASNGAEAVALFAQHRDELRLLVLDMVMPVMDGPSTIRAIQAMNAAYGSPPPPILALSGLPDRQCVSELVGANAFIAKPCSGEELLTQVAQILHKGAQLGTLSGCICPE